jgi:hypothetical protein
MSALELMVTGPETTVAYPVGSDDRNGLISMFALPSASAVIENTYVFPPASGGSVIEVAAVERPPPVAA